VKKRLFIAIDISEEVREAATDYIDRLSNFFPGAPVKWERPENLHLTLKFLGSTEDTAIYKVNDLVMQVAKSTGRFEIEIGGTGAFPSARSPRVLWLGVNDPSGSIGQVANRINSECERLGFEPESRPFQPHLTLARIRDPRNVGELCREHVNNAFGPIISPCRELVLYESRLRQNGSTYSTVLKAPFSDQ